MSESLAEGDYIPDCPMKLKDTVICHRLKKVSKMKRVLIINSILGIALSIPIWGGCDLKVDASLEIEREKLKKERVGLLMEIPKKFEDEWIDYIEGPESEFVRSLTRKQLNAIINLMSATDGKARTAARIRTINKTLEILTPGILIELVELTKTREDMLLRTPGLFWRMQSYKQRAVGYYNRFRAFAYDKQPESFAKWIQAERYYAEIKGQEIYGVRGKVGQELLFDLRNALIGIESVAEPYE